MMRLVNALNQAEYENDNVTLFISIDHSGTDELENYAKTITWKQGEKSFLHILLDSD